jgi:hypothetical protein
MRGFEGAPAMSVKASLLTLLEDLKRKAQEEQNAEDLAEISKLTALIETEGQKIVETPPYRVFLEKCLIEGEKPKTQEETREKLKSCAKKWAELPEDKKEKIEGKLEVRG